MKSCHLFFFEIRNLVWTVKLLFFSFEIKNLVFELLKRDFDSDSSSNKTEQNRILFSNLHFTILEWCVVGDSTVDYKNREEHVLWWLRQQKEFACNTGDPGLIPGLGRFSGEGNGYSLQYSGLENFMDRRAWRSTVRGVTKNQTRICD